MASIPTKKDKGATAPEANVCAHCLAPEGSHGVVLKACTRCKATTTAAGPAKPRTGGRGTSSFA